MLNYFILNWNVKSTPSEETAQRLIKKTRNNSDNWQAIFQKEGLIVFCRAPAPEKIIKLHNNSGVILGKIYRKAETPEDNLSVSYLSPDEANRIIQSRGDNLTKNFWGVYTSIISNNDTTVLIGRDCTGMQSCYKMWHNGVFLSFSYLDALPFTDEIKVQINWNYLAKTIKYTKASLLETGLINITQIAAGDYIQVNATKMEEIQFRSWKPEIFINNPIEEYEEAKKCLSNVTHAAVKAQSEAYERIQVNLSGGLDSSILLASLRKIHPPSKIYAFHINSAEGDLSERHFAQDIADMYDVKMHTLNKYSESTDNIIEILNPLSPIPNGDKMSGETYNNTILKFPDSMGANAVLTGQGGDQVFFKKPQISMLFDYKESNIIDINYLKILIDTARVTGDSVWNLLKKRGSMKRHRYRYTDNPIGNIFLSREIDERLGEININQSHPWFCKSSSFPFGKYHQLQHFSFFGRLYISKYSDDCLSYDNVMPFISQPLMETVLSIPSYILLTNGRNRGLAREIFRDMLPLKIYNREMKGYVTKTYFKNLVKNLKTLRPFLIDGLLVKEGLLDKKALEESLNEDTIITKQVGMQLMQLVGYEKWVRQMHHMQ